jgi:hypothetical protein
MGKDGQRGDRLNSSTTGLIRYMAGLKNPLIRASVTPSEERDQEAFDDAAQADSVSLRRYPSPTGDQGPDQGMRGGKQSRLINQAVEAGVRVSRRFPTGSQQGQRPYFFKMASFGFFIKNRFTSVTSRFLGVHA